MESQSGFLNDGRLSDDENINKKMENKDGKRISLFDQQGSHRHHSHEVKQSLRDHRDDKSTKSEKRMDRLNSSEKRARAEELHALHKQHSMERRLRKQTSNSSDDSDSDGPKKHSIFDIPDDGPVYVSMYDKVKARSCKNMQKQEEEKKIKAKFSQLKESRAKREEKKHSNSYDEESDSDMDTGEPRVKHTGGKMKHFLDSSTEDSDGRHSMNKDMVSDSGSSSRKGNSYRINRLNEICDGESSENSSLHQFSVKPRRRISSRKNSRSARITSETSDDASESVLVKQEPMEKSSEDMKCDVENEIVNIPKEEKHDLGQFKIKTEPVECPFENQTPERSSNLFDLSDGDSITPSSKTSETKESLFDNLFSAESKKRHKKNKKRQKSPSAMSSEEVKLIKNDEIKVEKTNPMESMFDELKRDGPNEKKRHGKKEKKRDKSSKEQHDKSKEEKYRMRKLKKQNRLPSDNSMFESQESFNSIKRGEKMEDIFGPISDDDSHISSTIDAHRSNVKSSTSNNMHSNKPNPQPTHVQNDNNSESKSSNLHLEKEKHREKKREKKRKEREKQQQSISSKDDDNSVDLDAAARAVEAQLLEQDNEEKPDEIIDFSYSTSKENINKIEPVDDVFRFSDNEDGPDNMFMSRKADSMDTHRSRDKKKKKKRSKEEKRHHHHHSSHSSSFISPPTTPRLTIDTDIIDDLPSSKQSPISIDDCKTNDEPFESKNKEIKHEPSHPSKHSDDKRKDSKALISGFGLEIDATIYKSAVQSIPTDFVSEKPEPEKITIEDKSVEMSADVKANEKMEEKSRVVISQEETEDAVAALLGESFGMSDDYSFTEDPIIEEGSNLQTSDGAIAEEEAEEMRKAVQSLGTEELDMKPDTPQSDNGLQIDTDTEEQDDGNALQIDESVTNDEPKPDSPKETKKSIVKENETKPTEITKGSVVFAPESKLETNKAVDVTPKPQASSDIPKSTIVTQPKTIQEQQILPPIIPKMVEAPTELLSVTISTPTLNKPNVIQVSSISNEKSKPSPPSTYTFLTFQINIHFYYYLHQLNGYIFRVFESSFEINIL